MASNNLAKSLKRSALTAAIGLCFVGGVNAQSNAAGAISGHAAAGDTITVTNANTGQSRTITVGSGGDYRFSSLPTGQYTVSRNGGEARDARVNVGTAATVDFVSAAGGSLGTVTVVGSSQVNPIDVSSVESTTILTAEQINKIPVPRDGTSVALLAPGTVRGDSAFGNLASFGGSSVAENQYFLNGFNITNTFQNLNFVQVPFEAIAEQQVKTGGYGAEFGRSTGGVLNQISKRGGNEFHAGGNIFYSPSSLDGTKHNTYDNNGVLYNDNSQDKLETTTAAVWASGALIKDRLFAYGLIQYGKTDQDAYEGILSGGTTFQAHTKRPNWLLKLDWNINDNNILEFTGLSDTRKIDTDYYSTNFDANGKPSRGDFLGTDYTENGGDLYVLKYTGYLTDTFTLSALAGHGTFKRNNRGLSASGIESSYTGDVGGPVAGCPLVIDGRTPAARAASPFPGTIPSCYLATQVGRPDAQDTRDQYRLDAEWQLGDHLIRGGVDIDNFESVAGVSYAGGEYWFYRNNTDVRRRVFQSGSTVAVDQTAYYIEDSWSITDNFIAYVGLRWDTFNNKNGNGETYVKISNQFAPRLGFSWDVFGDSSFKVFGNAGRYALPLTATVAVRGASQSLFSTEEYTYDINMVDPVTGAPIGATPVPGTFQYLNNEFGLGKNPNTIASTTLDPMYQDEYILGFQKQLTDNVSLGVRGIYRDLKRAIDDTCDYRPLVDWALANGFSADGGIFIAPEDKTQPNDIALYNGGFPFCRLYNPGQDAIYTVDVNGDGVLETIPVSAEQGGAAAKRKYSALEFFFQGNWDKLFLQGSYTYASSRGNTEGGVKSDNGQSDTGTTQDFDYPELIIGSYGYLPNDRRHTLKLFGNYEITDEWSVGGNLLLQSGRPINCFGIYGTRSQSPYGVSYFSCDNGPAEPLRLPDGSLNPNAYFNGTTIVPRGSAGRTPWTKTLDLNVAYKPNWAEGLQFKVDVFNVLNAQAGATVNENGEAGNGQPQPDVYKRITSYQAPRSVRFMIQYDF